MVVATSVVCHRAMTYNQSACFYRWFSSLLLFAVLTETAYHIITDEQVVHELSFIFVIVVVAIKTCSLIKLRVPNPNELGDATNRRHLRCRYV
jgi:dihydroceramidase